MFRLINTVSVICFTLITMWSAAAILPNLTLYILPMLPESGK
jgi:hypothetical protein